MIADTLKATELVGDFWLPAGLTPRLWRLARQLSGALGASEAPTIFSQIGRRMGPPGRERRAVVIRFLPGHISYPENQLALPPGFRPEEVLGGGELYCVGSDFSLQEGTIRFFDSPLELFPDRWFLAIGEPAAESAFQIVSGNHALGNSVRPITSYLLDSSSPEAWKAAAALAAGLAVLPRTSRLIYSRAYEQGRRYFFADFDLVAPYNHTALIDGQIYREGYVVVDDLALRQCSWLDGSWWNFIPEWAGGIPLAAFGPFDVRVPPVAAVRYHEDGPDEWPHCRIDLEGTATEKQKYWSATKQAELTTGNYLSQLVGITTAGQHVEVEAGAFLFGRAGSLRQRVTVCEIGENFPEDARARFAAYLRDEIPTGTLLHVAERSGRFSSLSERLTLGQPAWSTALEDDDSPSP